MFVRDHQIDNVRYRDSGTIGNTMFSVVPSMYLLRDMKMNCIAKQRNSFHRENENCVDMDCW